MQKYFYFITAAAIAGMVVGGVVAEAHPADNVPDEVHQGVQRADKEVREDQLRQDGERGDTTKKQRSEQLHINNTDRSSERLRIKRVRRAQEKEGVETQAARPDHSQNMRDEASEERRDEARNMWEKRLREREQHRHEVHERAAQNQEDIEARRQQMHEKIQQIRDEQRRRIAERLAEQMNRINERLTENYLHFIDRLHIILDKIESRAQRVGVSIDEALESARSTLVQLEEKVLAQQQKEYIVEIESMETLGEDFRRVKEELQGDHESLRVEVRAAREVVREVFSALKDAVVANATTTDSVDEEEESLEEDPVGTSTENATTTE